VLAQSLTDSARSGCRRCRPCPTCHGSGRCRLRGLSMHDQPRLRTVW
jgi:hypothetical protein